MDYLSIINKYYPENDELRQLLVKHSRQVADRCLQIAKKHKELPVDVQFLEEAAMLHLPLRCAQYPLSWYGAIHPSWCAWRRDVASGGI